MRPPSLRTILFRLHWALGLSAGLVLAVMGATGALMSYEEPLTAWANRDRATTATGQTSLLGLEALIARIEARSPGLRVRSLTLADDLATIARFARNPNDGTSSPAVYVDPYRGDVIGVVRWDEGFATMRALHRWLLIPGDAKGWGRTITGACALALVVLLVVGIYLRWPRVHRWRIWLKPSLSRPGRVRWWSLHAVMGTWLAPVYLVIALSGLTWSYAWFRDGVTWLLTGQVSQVAARREKGAVSPPALDRAWAAFRAADGRRIAQATVILPMDGAASIRIRWTPEDADASGLRNEAIFDAATGTLSSSERSAELPFGRRILKNMFEIHTGRFFGETAALAFCLAALAMPGFAMTGMVLYALRRRSARRRSGARSGTSRAMAEAP